MQSIQRFQRVATSELLAEMQSAVHEGPRLWQPLSWRGLAAAQQPSWEQPEALETVVQELSQYPGLVSAQEIEILKLQMGEAGLGRRFLLHGGDCAERFQDCREDHIRRKVQLILQMSQILGDATDRAIVPIGRIAGQYAKPRSAATETHTDGRQIEIFRGESINSFESTSEARKPDPRRLLQAFHCSSATLNFIRLMMGEGLKQFFVSHEALVLPYESAVTKFFPEHGRYYNVSTHLLWIGDRTRQIDGAHVEYCRGVGNPIGIKVSAETSPSELVALLSAMNPHNEPGKINLITRLGAGAVQTKLPELIGTIKQSGHSVTWSVDPMHGNTVKSLDGRKTRRFTDVASEIVATFAGHRIAGTHLGGVHLEMTPDPVTECTGGSAGIHDKILGQRYETWCDPRLNGSQSLELAFVIAECLSNGQGSWYH